MHDLAVARHQRHEARVPAFVHGALGELADLLSAVQLEKPTSSGFDHRQLGRQQAARDQGECKRKSKVSFAKVPGYWTG